MKKPVAKPKSYKTKENIPSVVSESEVAYSPVSKVSYLSNAKSDSEVLQIIKEGIPKKILDKTMSAMEISLPEMADILHVSERTLRRYDETTLLNTKQSERVVELIKLHEYGEAVLGGLAKFNHWMDSKILALGNKKPKEFLDTSIGIKLVMNILGRIEYGVYS